MFISDIIFYDSIELNSMTNDKTKENEQILDFNCLIIM